MGYKPQKDNGQYARQADAVLSQADPVSNTVYNVLPETKNVKILSLNDTITWATTQPTNMRIIVTVDGNVITYTVASPVSAQAYAPFRSTGVIGYAPAAQLQIADWTASANPIEAIEGRSVQVDIAITWATTQPTPLVCRIRYAKRS